MEAMLKKKTRKRNQIFTFVRNYIVGFYYKIKTETERRLLKLKTVLE